MTCCLSIVATCAVALATAVPGVASALPGGYGLLFDGSLDCASVEHSSTFPLRVFTASAWIKTPGNALRSFILTPGEDDFNDLFPWGLYVTVEGSFAVQIGDDIDFQAFYDSGVFVADNSWHHVAATRADDAQLVLYVDGSPVLLEPASLTPTENVQQRFTFGCVLAGSGPPPPGGQTPGGFLPGCLDEIAIWNRALTAAEVAELPVGPPSSTDSGLVGLWLLDEGVGQYLSDDSPADNDGVRGFDDSEEPADPEWKMIDPPVSIEGRSWGRVKAMFYGRPR